ncbi:MAG: CorA family divalent cation transporter [Lawsonibacter sp.]|jgi:magnesium transporter
MHLYAITPSFHALEHPPTSGAPALLVLSSEELTQIPPPPGLENILHHTPAARDARVCKAEVRRDCLSGTLVVPRTTRVGSPIAIGYLLTRQWAVFVDDTGIVLSHLKQIAQELHQYKGGTGRLFYTLLERLTAKDLHHLEELENQAQVLEERVLTGDLAEFSVPLSALHKQAVAWFRYYSQLDDVAFTLRENENGFFDQSEQHLFRMFEAHIIRLREESQLLRESCLQIQSLFQSEISIRQNQIMKILTIVTTIFLPLSLLAGWYGMNFSGMPELTWKYGYPAVIGLSLLIVLLSLWVMRRKKFW